MKYRHEWKHEISYPDLVVLRARLAAVAKPDPHANGGKYHIRSLYFDTPSDKALREKRDGVNRREKFRIRMYNLDPSFIRLEKKSKVNGLCLKESAILTKEQVAELLSGNLEVLRQGEPLLMELYVKIRSQGLRPKTIVDYEREPFIFAPGNVRVTLDYNIRTALKCTDFLNSKCVTFPAGDAPIILEVKWDEYLPDIIRNAVQLRGRRVGAFSKYAACRIYD